MIVKTELPRGITANNAHSRSYPRITIYTWNRACFHLRQDFLIMPSLDSRSRASMKINGALIRAEDRALVPRGIYISVAQKLVSFSLVVKPHVVNAARRPTTRGSEPFSPRLCHNTSGLRAVRRFIVSRHKIASGTLHVPVFNVRESHSIAGRR